MDRFDYFLRSGAQFRWRTWRSMKILEDEFGAEALKMTTTLAMLVRLVPGAERSPAVARVSDKFDPDSGH